MLSFTPNYIYIYLCVCVCVKKRESDPLYVWIYMYVCFCVYICMCVWLSESVCVCMSSTRDLEIWRYKNSIKDGKKMDYILKWIIFNGECTQRTSHNFWMIRMVYPHAQIIPTNTQLVFNIRLHARIEVFSLPKQLFHGELQRCKHPKHKPK